MRRPVVDVLTFEGCPHAQAAVELAERVVDELALHVTVRRVDVSDVEAAAEQRFLGSPTIRVDGRDVEPGADERTDYALACRIYRTETGIKDEPEERWLREALLAAA